MGQKILTKITILVLLHLGPLVAAQECNNGEIRSVPIRDSGSAIVRKYPQYCFNGEWRMFCTGGIAFPPSQVTSRVLCRHLGYSDQGAIISNSNPVSPTEHFVRPTQACFGTENRIQDCPGSIEPLDTCGDLRKASIECRLACTNGEIRLVGGSSENEGRVNVCMDGRWGTVCNNQEGLAGAVCAQLGFAREGLQDVRSFAPGFVTNIFICSAQNGGSLNCTQVTDASCDHTMDLGVVCRTYEELYNDILSDCTSTGTLTIATDPTCYETAEPILLSFIAVLVALLFGTVTALAITCGALKKSTSQQNTPGPVAIPVSEEETMEQPYTLVTSIASNPAYNLVNRHDNLTDSGYEVVGP